MFLKDKRKRIVLVEDHAVVRQGLERLLNVGEEFVVSEEAGDGTEGIEVVREMRPDAVIVDVELPGGTDGIELAAKLQFEFPAIVVLILSAHEEPEYALPAAKAGAMGYILKREGVDAVRNALRDAFKGKRTFSDEVLRVIT